MTARPTSARVMLFATPRHACSYLPGRDAATEFVDPEFPKDPAVYTMLSRNGFRRSGRHVYRPACPDCRACVPVRVPVARFRPSRSQRRAWRANVDLRVTEREACFDEEHFRLYYRYLEARHKDGGMDDPTRRQYREFLLSGWTHTSMYEFRLGGRLVCVAVADRLLDGLSAVYTFFDPSFPRRSLGTYCILWEIEHARRTGLDWLYLGYWIAGCPSMRYKDAFLPQERFVDGGWRRTHRRSRAA